MSQIHKHTIPANIADRCLINPQQYEAMYQQSINAPAVSYTHLDVYKRQGVNALSDLQKPRYIRLLRCLTSVSYTHLDVYKRQGQRSSEQRGDLHDLPVVDWCL